MILYNLYLVLYDEPIKVFDNAAQRTVYKGSSEEMPDELMNALVHDITIAHEDNRTYILININ